MREGLQRLEPREDSLIARILACAARTRELVAEGDRSEADLARLESTLAASRGAVDAVLQQAESAMEVLVARVGELEAQARTSLARLAGAREETRGRAREALAARTAAQVQAQAALDRLRRARLDTLPVAVHCVEAARSAISLVLAAAEASAQAAAAAAEALAARARASQSELQQARTAARQATAEVVRRSAELGEVVTAHLRALQQDLETARADHRRRFGRLAEEVRSSAQDWASVQERFAVALAAELTAMSEELNRTLEEMRAMPRPPHALADRDLFASTRRLRETFEPLANVERIWKLARERSL